MADGTTQQHPLHRKIGDALKARVDGMLFGYEVILDPDCGGGENIPFYMTDQRRNEARLCNVDALVLDQMGQPRVAIEIDEATLKPTQVCGKFLTAALASTYIHRSHPGVSPARLENLLFVQVVDDSQLKEKTGKHQQSRMITEKIRGLLNLGAGFSVSRYELFWASDLGENCSDLVRLVEGFVQDVNS